MATDSVGGSRSLAALGAALGRYDAFALGAALWFLAKLLRYAFPALFPTFRSEFGVSTAVLGGAFAATMGAYSLLQFPSGVLADRLGPGTVIAAGAAVVALACAVLWLSAPFAVVVAGMVLVGVGTGVHKTVSVDLLSRVYPDRTGRALGLFDTIGAFGGVAAPPAVVFALSTTGWRGLFLAGGVGALVLGVGVSRRVVGRVDDRPGSGTGGHGTDGPGDADADGPEVGPADGADPVGANDADADGTGSVREYVGLFSDPRFAVFVGAVLCVGFSYSGFAAFLPLFLTDRGVPAPTVSALFSLLFVVSLVQLVTGDLSDRVGRLPLLTGLLAVSVVGFVVLVGVAGTAPLVLGVAVVLVGIGGHGYRPVRSVHLTALVPGAVVGGALGMVRTLLMAVSAAAPAVVGVVADAVGFDPAFRLLGAAMGLGAVLGGVAVVLER